MDARYLGLPLQTLRIGLASGKLDQILNAILRAEQLSCVRGRNGQDFAKVERVSLAIERGTLTFLCGGPASGRALLARLLGLLERPDSGEIFLHGAPTSRLDPQMRCGIRTQHFGYIFSDPFLLPSLSVLENVAMPLMKVASAMPDKALSRSMHFLKFVGLLDEEIQSVECLSVDQQLRVSLARALVNQPEIIVAEDLDATLSGAALMEFRELLERCVREFGVTCLASLADAEPGVGRVVEMHGGAITRDTGLVAKGESA
jgi:ABC-type lipoprotein export system ATPase subunit